MKLLKYEHRVEILTVDATHIYAGSSITVDTTVTDEYSNLSLDFVPRISPNVTVLDNLRVHITNEFTKEEYNVPVDIEVLSNSIYRLYFLEDNFFKPESKYSIDIKSLEETIYKGKVMVAAKDIQNYRYTNIEDNKFYL